MVVWAYDSSTGKWRLGDQGFEVILAALSPPAEFCRNALVFPGCPLLHPKALKAVTSFQDDIIPNHP